MSRRVIPGLSTCMAVALAATLTAHPAIAGGTGQPDTENRYPNSGAIVVTSGFPGVPFIQASGVLIHPRVLLCAGHSTAAGERLIAQGIPLFEHFRVNFGPDAFHPLVSAEAVAMFTHPGHVENPDLPVGIELAHDHDLGVVILKEPVDLPCATLPSEGLLDDLKRAGLLGDQGNPVKFIAAGYGATLEFPPPEEVRPDGLRRVSFPEDRAGETVWLLMNQNFAAGNSGVAGGDSGCPVFWRAPDGELIAVGITSQTDAQRVSVFWASRTDLAESLDFIEFVFDLVDDGLL
jgi:hypothetical protein